MKYKENKDDAGYTVIPQAGRRCDLCAHYRPVPDTTPPSGLSDATHGIVEASASCDNFQLAASVPIRPRKEGGYLQDV